jgi:hypothetical protein
VVDGKTRNSIIFEREEVGLGDYKRFFSSSLPRRTAFNPSLSTSYSVCVAPFQSGTIARLPILFIF